MKIFHNINGFRERERALESYIKLRERERDHPVKQLI